MGLRECYSWAHSIPMCPGLPWLSLRSSEGHRKGSLMKPPRWGLFSLTLDRVPSAQRAGHKPCHCAQVTTILCFQPLGCLCDKGRWGPAPNCVP